MKSIKKHIPEFPKLAYHKVRSYIAALVNGFPARSVIVIGITGTKGKTSTANYMWSVMQAGGYKAGLISSANFRTGEIEEPNPHHMTMPDPFLIQKKMRAMVKAGVTVIAMEMTSEGMKQYRHSGIPVDIAVFTNLTPEHLRSHNGDFAVYKKAKSKLFTQGLHHAQKTIQGKKILRTIIANADSEHTEYYLQFAADKKITYGLTKGDVLATAIVPTQRGTTFSVNGIPASLAIPGEFNIYNAVPAFIAGTILGIPTEKIVTGLAALKVIPGRMEIIDEGQPFTVVVDYAHEPASLNALLSAAEKMKEPNGKIILLMGCIGGGRESRVPLAELGAKKADYLIITNEDPYDEDPRALITELSIAAQKQGKQLHANLFTFLDRREAIQKAVALAGEGDIVLISGKGAEQTMITAKGAVPWNERAIVREIVRTSSN